LDDDRLSVTPNAGADHELAVRLRTLKGRQQARLSAGLVLKLAESAWIVAKERQIASMLGDQPHLLDSFERSDDYAQPTWRRGYELAERARQLLGIDPLAPIPSVRRVTERLRVPLIQAELGQVFAGATVENANHRGIVVNTQGDNQNVWVRRMTLCHELGHLLWDPTHRLERLHVDRYSEIQAPQPEPVESRANAFAIAFLAPRDAVVAIIQKHSNAAAMLAELMSTYGIAATAAKYHLANIALEWGTPIDTTRVRSTLLPVPDHDWQVNENWTIDFFQPSSTPISRRGRFAGVVAVAAMSKIITLDQAASYLSVASEQLGPYLSDIAQMTAPDLIEASRSS
jgi:Zn-dependent peptidase ImmA (M78 family)